MGSKNKKIRVICVRNEKEIERWIHYNSLDEKYKLEAARIVLSMMLEGDETEIKIEKK